MSTDLTSNSFFETTDEALDAMRTNEATIGIFTEDPMTWIDLYSAARSLVLHGDGSRDDIYMVGLRNKLEFIAEQVMDAVADDDRDDRDDEGA